ncbi:MULTISPECIES: VENN motif pre-toxin domain-containing protein [unclassified Variovorax]|uniref:VENN motif pre-toxin domain-containing protein n=1 Tax=unclassified Variovorax TaxID=663243 RepID=UPI0008C71320|nr:MULTISPECIES: VENN motif pre-toxin domain-containing protein [unclassified Variovorax]SEK12814.1 Pre-toxin domain with VENN motif-containing protein [Variovorax sp. OK202]SFD83546.1 Pre-toxin domain with VENN motif-containing protein [Variovorax sp. OK212]
MYQRTRDDGARGETANYTQIDSKKLTLDTPTVNVQLGQNATKGPNQTYIAQQTLEQVLQGQRDQTGMDWLNRIQKDPALSDLKINWQGVPLEQRQWAEKQGSLTQAGGAVVAIVATVLTWGAASSVGAAAGSAVSGGTTGPVGHMAGSFYNPSNDAALATATVLFGQMMAGIAGALVGGNQASADIASQAGANAVENNQLGRRYAPKTPEEQQKRMGKLFSLAADFMDSFQDFCRECSAAGFKSMNASISSEYAEKPQTEVPRLRFLTPMHALR